MALDSDLITSTSRREVQWPRQWQAARDAGGLPFRHPLVRALAWLIGSPGLLQGPAMVSDQWCVDALDGAQQWLLALDDAPAELESFVSDLRIARIGRLAEALLGFWLAHDPRFALLAQNLAVRDGGRTLGDFDFVVRDQRDGSIMHWELTVKFYLHRPEIGGFSGYVGPGERDILAAKADHISARQLQLAHTPAGRATLEALGVERIAPLGFCKGWLFYGGGDAGTALPGLNPYHGRGLWWRHAAGDAVPLGNYQVIERLEWLSAPACGPSTAWLNAMQLARVLDERVAGAGQSLQVVRRDDAPSGKGGATFWSEASRAFVVPASWGTSTQD